MKKEFNIINSSVFKKIVSVLIVISLFFVLNTNAANAQSALDIGIYPPIIQAQMTPPAQVKVPIYVENFSQNSVSLNISLKPFKASPNENGQVDFSKNIQYPDPLITQRITVFEGNKQIQNITLSPKQTKKLSVEFKIPQDEPKGDYYFSLVFSSAGQNPGDSTSTQATGAVATNILLTVGPIGKTQGVLENFSAPQLLLQGPVPFTVRLKNTSDHYITPTGDIEISNIFGQNAGTVTLLPVNILADSVRRIPDKLQTGNNPDFNKIKAIVDNSKYPVAVWPQTFLIGLYKADLTISLSSSGPVFKKSIYFFAFPAQYILGILIIIGILIYIVMRVRKKMA